MSPLSLYPYRRTTQWTLAPFLNVALYPTYGVLLGAVLCVNIGLVGAMLSFRRHFAGRFSFIFALCTAVLLFPAGLWRFGYSAYRQFILDTILPYINFFGSKYNCRIWPRASRYEFGIVFSCQGFCGRRL